MGTPDGRRSPPFDGGGELLFLKDVAAWRPSMPSFSFGGSGLGMRARDAISVLDSILEENGTEDIPKSFLIGLGALALVLALLVILALIF